MSVAIVYSRAQLGIEASLVTIEVHLSNGLPGLAIGGLPEAAIKESKDRVRSALITSQFRYPLRRITVNLAPADLPKQSGRYDLPIALGILAASGQVPQGSLKTQPIVAKTSPKCSRPWCRKVLEHGPLIVVILLAVVFDFNQRFSRYRQCYLHGDSHPCTLNIHTRWLSSSVFVGAHRNHLLHELLFSMLVSICLQLSPQATQPTA